MTSDSTLDLLVSAVDSFIPVLTWEVPTDLVLKNSCERIWEGRGLFFGL